MGRPKKEYIHKKEARKAIFIALLVALILYGIEAIAWTVELITEPVLKQYNLPINAHSIGIAISAILIGYFAIQEYKKLED